MREIKFRAKVKEEGMKKIWEEGSLVHITSTYKGEEDEQDCDIYQIIDEEGVGLYVDKKTIGQYTGLKDKNGKEIYEGDIVKAKWFDKTDVIGEIYFSQGCFILANSCVSDNQLFIFYNIEVIGNIYDNKEILED